MYINKLRPAIAMIELIFSIVIMGFVLLSAPMLIRTASKSTTVALQQEGVNEVSARINMILTYEWDENNAKGICASWPTVLGVADGDDELNPVGGTRKRRGVPAASHSHTFDCLGDVLDATAAVGMEGDGILDDQDDFADTNLTNVLLGNGGKDYLEQAQINIATHVNYATDAANYQGHKTFAFNFDPNTVAGPTNIKAIAVTLTSTSGVEELNKTITMHAFSCNIGSYRFASRTF